MNVEQIITMVEQSITMSVVDVADVLEESWRNVADCEKSLQT